MHSKLTENGFFGLNIDDPVCNIDFIIPINQSLLNSAVFNQ